MQQPSEGRRTRAPNTYALSSERSFLCLVVFNLAAHYCCDELRATDTSIAAEVLAEADEYGTVVPKVEHLAPVARKLDNAIHWIKFSTVHTLIHRVAIYPLDSVIRPLLVQLGPGPFLLLAADNTNVNEETLDGKNNSCDIHACISETAEYMNQNHPRSNWQTTMTGNYPYRQGEGFTS